MKNNLYIFFVYLCHFFSNGWIKWKVFSQTVIRIKKMIFSTRLEVHLDILFWVQKVSAEILAWAKQSGTQFFSVSNLLIVSKTWLAIRFQFFDIWWSSLDMINDFKAISRIVFFCFGEINRSFFLSFFGWLLHF